MPVKCEEYNQVCVMAIEGDFVGPEIEPARNVLAEQMDKRQIVDFVFDFEKSGLIDSEGLEFLLSTKEKCEQHFGKMKLVCLDDNMKKILEMTRLEHKFESHPDLAAALKNMR